MQHFRRGQSQLKGGFEIVTILVKVVVCKTTFGGDMSPLKVCVENAMGGQRDCVPAQRCFCRLATFGGDKGVAAESVVACRPVCCSVLRKMIYAFGHRSVRYVLSLTAGLENQQIDAPVASRPIMASPHGLKRA